MSEAVRKPASLALDTVLHQPMRLGVASILAARGETTFNELREALEASDGNLATHLRHLEDAGYVAIEKRFERRRPLSICALTPRGRAAFTRYLNHLEVVLKEAKR